MGREVVEEFISSGIIGRTIKAIQAPNNCKPRWAPEESPYTSLNCQFLRGQKGSAEWLAICFVTAFIFGVILARNLFNKIKIYVNKNENSLSSNTSTVCNPVTIIDFDELENNGRLGSGARANRGV